MFAVVHTRDSTGKITNGKKRHKRCTQCEAMMINGVYCHEQGCPNIVKESPKK